MRRFQLSRFSELEVGDMTDPGPHYQRNEDHHWFDGRRGLFLLADGIGSNPGGEVASELAVKRMRRCLTDTTSQDAEGALNDALLSAHQEIRKEADKNRDLRGMGTTALITWVRCEGAELWTAHVGNSRAYLYTHARPQLTRLTEDHTLLEVVRQSGQLPEDRKLWPPKSLLSQSLGASELIAPQVRRHELRDGDLVLLCTDGVSDVLSDMDLAEILKSGLKPQNFCDRIKEEVLNRGAPDNLTAIAFRLYTWVE